MPINLYQELLKETDEERVILEKNEKVRKDIYTDQVEFIIDFHKFLNEEKMIMVRKHTRFVDFPKHKHNYIEMNYVYHGRLEQKVGNEPIVLKKGELLFLNQHIEHEINACNREDIIINFIIHPQFFDYIFTYLTTENIESNIGDFLINSIFNYTNKGQFLYYAVSEVEAIQELVQKIIMEILEPSILSQSTIKLYMGLLMIELIKHSDKIKKQNNRYMQQQLILEAFKYIDEHFKKASLFELAQKLNQPHYRLSKYIKKVTNQTFKDLLQERRLREARELLKNSDIPISMIVEQIGYDNISYFYRIFKNKYGVTPKKYREKLVHQK